MLYGFIPTICKTERKARRHCCVFYTVLLSAKKRCEIEKKKERRLYCLNENKIPVRQILKRSTNFATVYITIVYKYENIYQTK